MTGHLTPAVTPRPDRRLAWIGIGLGALLATSLSVPAVAIAPAITPVSLASAAAGTVDVDTVEADTVEADTVSTASATSRLLALESCRLIDTRNDPRFANAAPAPGTDIVVQVTGNCGVPADAAAVAVVLTSMAAARTGWLAVYPTATGWPGISSLNLAAGETRANGSVLALDGNGSLTVKNDAGGHITLDVGGAFLPATSSSNGRFVSTAVTRLVDTRASGRPAAGGVVRVPLPAGVPGDAVAVAINLTTADTGGAGFFTTYPAGANRPPTAMLHSDRAGQTRATTIIVPVTSAGFDVYTSRGDHVIVDIAGYFTGASASDSNAGLFVPVTPARLIDSRLDRPPLHPGGTRQFATAQITGGAVAAVVATVTMSQPRAAGWVLAYPAQTPFPNASTLNAVRSETVANQALAPVSTTGLAVFSSGGTDIVVDITGAFTGTPRPASEPPADNPEPPRGPGRTLIVGDSVAAIFHHVQSTRQPLAGLDYALEVSSCRRTVGRSGCVFSNVRPVDALTGINNARGPINTIVMATGYNDWHAAMPGMIDQIMAAARRRGVEQVYWMTLSTRGQGDYQKYRDNYTRINQHLRDAAARMPDLEVLDWNQYSAGRSGWFGPDGIHLTTTGGGEFARFINSSLTGNSG
jgi:hypothetical protein